MSHAIVTALGIFCLLSCDPGSKRNLWLQSLSHMRFVAHEVPVYSDNAGYVYNTS